MRHLLPPAADKVIELSKESNRAQAGGLAYSQ